MCFGVVFSCFVIFGHAVLYSFGGLEAPCDCKRCMKNFQTIENCGAHARAIMCSTQRSGTIARQAPFFFNFSGWVHLQL